VDALRVVESNPPRLGLLHPSQRRKDVKMDVQFALTGKNYVLIAADTNAARSIVKMKVDEDKISVLSPHLLMGFSGEPGM
jgi:20S proteasome alpha/beta subunit